MICLAFTFRVFGALDSQSDAARGAEFEASVFLVSGKRAVLVELRFKGFFGTRALLDDERPLDAQPEG